MNENQIFIEQISPFDVATTVEKIIEAAIKKEWQNTTVKNLQLSDAKSGNVMRPAQVIEICKPEYSEYMHEKNQDKVVTVMTMPCRISVYEKEDRKTYVSLLNMSAMVTGLLPSTNEVLRDASQETFDIVKSVIGSF